MSNISGVLGDGGSRPIQLFSCLAEHLMSLISGFLGEVSLLQGHLLLRQMSQQLSLSLLGLFEQFPALD